jgi:hypothetical protein
MFTGEHGYESQLAFRFKNFDNDSRARLTKRPSSRAVKENKTAFGLQAA